jgi:hypothetical protein
MAPKNETTAVAIEANTLAPCLTEDWNLFSGTSSDSFPTFLAIASKAA